MTRNASRKRAARNRMALTGENYTRARRATSKAPSSNGGQHRAEPFPLDTDLSTLTETPALEVEARYRATLSLPDLDGPDLHRWIAMGSLLQGPAWGRYATSRAIPYRHIRFMSTQALLGGWQATVTGLRANPEVGDVIVLHGHGPRKDVELTWTLTGTGTGCRRAAAEGRGSSPLSPSTIVAVEAALAAPVQTRRPPGACECCHRTAPPEADLDRNPPGLCAPCELWHLVHPSGQVPDPACAHSTAVPRQRRWWREDERTEPDDGDCSWAEAAGLEAQATHAGLYLSAGLNWGDAGEPNAVIEFFHDWDTGAWSATRERHPVARRRPTRPAVTWELIPDIARHEIVELLTWLRTGQVACPPQYAAPVSRSPS